MQNYHRHTSYSEGDSAAMPEEYAKRAVELGHKVISSVEHGWQGYYHKAFELAKEYNLKFIFGTEAYWVKDRFEKDRSNNHIIILAKNENGRRAINRILSDANETGYFYKPRVDLELIFSLPPDDVFVTSACIGFWLYDDVDDIVVRMHDYFKDNFMLEIQNHNTEKQKQLNEHIKQLSEKYNIEMIVGLDSHYIYPEQSVERDDILAGRNIKFDDNEIGWYMDYPDDDTVRQRFREQGVFDDKTIQKAMDNADILLTFDDYDNVPVFTTDIKLPTLYPDKTQAERNKIYSTLISKLFKEYMKNIPKEKYKEYYDGVKQEVSVYKETGMVDYPLMDYAIIKRGIEKGGLITTTGRGSAVGYFTNTLCGFSKVDRFSAPIKLYPERFISKTRILETKSLPDLDMNLGTIEPFAEAQEEILGKDHAYPMIAFGTLKKKSAFKLYARATNLDFEIANAISKQIEKYDEAVKYADDDEKDDIDIYDYVDEQYRTYIEKSEKYWGVIDHKNKAPCFPKGTLIYTTDGYKPIELIRVGDKVLTHTGDFCNVLYINKTPNQLLYQLNTIGRENINLTENHPVLCRRLKRERYKQINGNWSIKRTFSNPEWIEAKDINAHDVVGCVINNNSIIPTFNGLENYINNKDFWWIVGRWVGDGWCEYYEPKNRRRIKICCAKTNKEVLDIENHLDGLIPYRKEENRTVFKFVLKDNNLYDFFQNFGKYANGKKIPQFVIDLPLDLLTEFLNGYISADGHYQKCKNQFILSSVSKELIYGLQQCIHKAYKVPTTFDIRPENIDIIEGRKVKRKESYILKFHLDKRRNDRSFYENGYIWYWVSSVVKTEKYDDVYNFEVEKDNSYTVYNMCVHNCAYLLYQGSIREEIGLIKCKSESTKKEYITTVIDGAVAEKYKFLKNDLLKVDVVLLIDMIYKRIGIPVHSATEISNLVENDQSVWDIYANGYTIGVNQCEKESAIKKLKRYKPKNISELAAWIAAIRPAFKSMYSKFESREPFEYGIHAFDKILQTPQFPYSYILYQEQTMNTLNYAGFPLDECYGIIKAIAKKHPEKVKPLKDRFIEGFKNKIIQDDNVEPEKAAEMSAQVWQIINDSCGYGFNSAHAFCMALDSLYCAWLKAHYPYEFYEVLLQVYSDKGKKDKVQALKQEMRIAFGIEEGEYKFGADNRHFVADKKNHCIYPSLLSIKGLSQGCANDLYNLSQKNKFDNFYDLWKAMNSIKTLNSSKIDTLIKMNYFQDFGSIEKIEEFMKAINALYDRSQFNKDNIPSGYEDIIKKYSEETEKTYRKFDYDSALKEMLSTIPNKKTNISKLIQYQNELFGYISYTNPKFQNAGFVVSLDTKYSPKATIYMISDGTTITAKVSKSLYQKQPFDTGCILKFYVEDRYKSKKGENGEWIKTNEKELWITSYIIKLTDL